MRDDLAGFVDDGSLEIGLPSSSAPRGYGRPCWVGSWGTAGARSDRRQL